jgi:hypothetical protein
MTIPQQTYSAEFLRLWENVEALDDEERRILFALAEKWASRKRESEQTQ